MTQHIVNRLRTVAALVCTVVLLLGQLPGVVLAQSTPAPPAPSLSAPVAAPGPDKVEMSAQASPDLSPWGMFLTPTGSLRR
jgi:hypothetical protein